MLTAPPVCADWTGQSGIVHQGQGCGQTGPWKTQLALQWSVRASGGAKARMGTLEQARGSAGSRTGAAGPSQGLLHVGLCSHAPAALGEGRPLTSVPT